MRFSEAATRVALQKKVFLEILQNSQENTCARVSFFSKVAGLGRLWHRCFPVNFAKFLRTPFLQNTTGRLLIDFTVKPVYSGHLRFLEKSVRYNHVYIRDVFENPSNIYDNAFLRKVSFTKFRCLIKS